MVQPLTKRDKSGAIYTRPAVVEAQIGAVLDLDRQALRARLRVTDRKSSEYLVSECLVHLSRQAMRDNDQARANMVITTLLSRCEANLKVKIPNGDFANAPDLREEVLGQLSEMFAVDGAQDADELDYFEIRFFSALRALRVDVIRAEANRQKRIAPLPPDTDEGEDEEGNDEIFSRIAKAFQTPATQQSTMQLQDLHAAIQDLPEEEKRAVLLVHVMEYKVESSDSEEVTAATLCGCSGRTIRNRLASAAAKLKQFKED
jgi:hypothetical protein